MIYPSGHTFSSLKSLAMRVRLLLGVIFVLGSGVLWTGCGGEKVKTEERKSTANISLKDRGPYPEDRVTVPRYPGAVVENYEEAFAPGGKEVSFVRVYLNTTDSYDKVRDFYKKAFREKYGEPTEEGEEKGIYHVMKAKGKEYAPYFQIEVTDLGDYRRIVITRSDRNK